MHMQKTQQSARLNALSIVFVCKYTVFEMIKWTLIKGVQGCLVVTGGIAGTFHL